MFKTDARLSPPGSAARIMIDPLDFGPTFSADDALIGGLTLNADFLAHIDDPYGSAYAVFQAASNMQTTEEEDFAPIGRSYEGLPLIYTLGFTFLPTITHTL